MVHCVYDDDDDDSMSIPVVVNCRLGAGKLIESA